MRHLSFAVVGGAPSLSDDRDASRRLDRLCRRQHPPPVSFVIGQDRIRAGFGGEQVQGDGGAGRPRAHGRREFSLSLVYMVRSATTAKKGAAKKTSIAPTHTDRSPPLKRRLPSSRRPRFVAPRAPGAPLGALKSRFPHDVVATSSSDAPHPAARKRSTLTQYSVRLPP
jgi:hypothetical protein